MLTGKKINTFNKTICLILTFGYGLLTANPTTTHIKQKEELDSQPKNSRIVSHLANYGYLYVLTAAAVVIGIFAHRNAKLSFAQRLADLQKLGFSNAEKMAHAMSKESIESLKGLLAANISLEDAKAVNKAHSYQTVNNILLLLKNKTITLEKAVEFADIYPDRGILLTIRETAAQGPEALAKLLADMTKANIELKKARIRASAIKDAACTKAQGLRDAASIQAQTSGSSVLINSYDYPTRGTIIQGDGLRVRIR
ncbi:MAG TPA: hypothetical protein VGT41_03060 [Candidatus Babeliales bacterium]|nr:hypothetical protein [Candidatus Babeliales bacterium]